MRRRHAQAIEVAASKRWSADVAKERCSAALLVVTTSVEAILKP